MPLLDQPYRKMSRKAKFRKQNIVAGVSVRVAGCVLVLRRRMSNPSCGRDKGYRMAESRCEFCKAPADAIHCTRTEVMEDERSACCFRKHPVRGDVKLNQRQQERRSAWAIWYALHLFPPSPSFSSQACFEQPTGLPAT